MKNPNIEDTERRSALISEALAGATGGIQGAALADALAMWLAGHRAGDGRTDELRERLLAMHIEHVRKLIPVNESLIKIRHARREGARQC